MLIGVLICDKIKPMLGDIQKTTKRNLLKGIPWRFGPNYPGPRCEARTRKGTACQNPPIKGKSRCRLHGGLSTGPKTPEGKAACIAAHWKHGRRSRAYIETRKKIWADLRLIEIQMRQTGII